MFRLRDDHILRRFDLAARAVGDRREAGERPGTPGNPSPLVRQLTRTEARLRDVSAVFQRLLDDERTERPMSSLESSGEGDLDYETFRHFSEMLLDEWSRAVGHLAGLDKPHHFDFSALAAAVDSESLPPVLLPVREALLRHVRWLHFWLVTYRSESVDAGDTRTRARSNTAENDNIGFDENWMPNRARSLLTRVVENITNLDRSIDRERIASLAAEAALRAPSVQIVASVVADFMNRSVSYVLEAAAEKSNTIDLGAVRAGRASSGSGPSDLS
jgi:hypothetical protein